MGNMCSNFNQGINFVFKTLATFGTIAKEVDWLIQTFNIKSRYINHDVPIILSYESVFLYSHNVLCVAIKFSRLAGSHPLRQSKVIWIPCSGLTS